MSKLLSYEYKETSGVKYLIIKIADGEGVETINPLTGWPTGTTHYKKEDIKSYLVNNSNTRLGSLIGKEVELEFKHSDTLDMDVVVGIKLTQQSSTVVGSTTVDAIKSWFKA